MRKYHSVHIIKYLISLFNFSEFTQLQFISPICLFNIELPISQQTRIVLLSVQHQGAFPLTLNRSDFSSTLNYQSKFDTALNKRNMASKYLLEILNQCLC